MKRLTGIALGFILAACVCVTGFKMTSLADTVSINISASAPTVEKEETFNMRVEVSSDLTVQSLDSLITYNPQVLEFVSCEDDAVAGASGTIHIIDAFEEGTNSVSYDLTFKALEVGESNVTLGETIVQEYGSSRLIDAASSPVSINVEKNTQVSSDNTLSELMVYPGELDEDFTPEQYEYHLTVGAETETIVLSATPSDEMAIVTVDIPKHLEFGENTAYIYVKALSGDEAVYTIHITKLERNLLVEDVQETADVEDTSETIVVEETPAVEETLVIETESES